MKSFLKFTLASFIGFLLGGIILLFLGIGIIGAVASMGSSDVVKVKNKSILKISLDKTLVDKATKDPFSKFDFMGYGSKGNVGLSDILDCIQRAKTDDKIKGIYLNVGGISGNFGGLASIEEIRNKLADFKKSGKFIVSYNNFGYSQKAYYLNSVADSVYLNPEASFMFIGMGGEMTFYKNFLKKIGVEAQVIRVGKYKSATEQFFRDNMSAESREQTMAYVGAIWNKILSSISKSRNVSVGKLNDILNTFAIKKAIDAKRANLIDDVLYQDQMDDILRKLSGIKANKKLRFVSISDYAKAPKGVRKIVKDKVAVVYATGAIGGKQSPNSIGPELAKTIQKVRKDSTVKAIVLRVNSPGGSALVSDIIWREVALAAKVKPVIASMGNVAASGGYYISCAADTIVADTTTITGSIGIYGLFFSGEDLIKNKIGFTSDNFGTNKYSSFGGAYPIPFAPISSRKFTKSEKAILQGIINNGYDTFLTRVANGRHKTKAEIHEVAQGRVWVATDAKKHGLVDVLGGLETAIDIAKKKADLQECRIVAYPKEKDPFEKFVKDLTGDAKIKFLKNELGTNYRFYEKSKQILELGGIQARVPYELEID